MNHPDPSQNRPAAPQPSDPEPGAYGYPAPGGYPPPGPRRPAPDPRMKSPALAGFLSLVPGLGQIYVGYYARGFVHALVVVSLMTILNNLRSEALIPLFAPSLIFFWLYNIVDAIRRASLYNRYLEGREEIELPQDFRLAAPGGSIGAGLLLMGVGFILLLHTRFDFSLEWLEEWWPVIPMLVGAYLFGRAILDRAQSSGTSDPQR